MSILQTLDLKKYYGTEPNITRTLDGVNFSVEDGEFVTVVGTSGSGKSTLLFSIITFASTIITNIATKKREYAMFQSIGMTRKQTEKMALCESCVLAIGSLILTLILGIILGQILIKGLISAGIFYLSYTFPLALFTVYCIVVVLIILMITISAFYSLQKTPLVERLRIVD